MLFAGLPAAFAKDIRTKYEEAKLFRQQDTLFIEELNQKILQRAKDDLAAIPVEPIARKGESSDVRKRREARAKLEKVINELEIKMIDLENSFKSSPYFMGSTDKDPAIVSYAASIEERIEKYVANQSFKINSPIRDGSASLFFFIREDGKLDRIEVRSATSKDFGEYVLKLVKELTPFEPFPADLAAQGNMMIFNREFNFTKE
jgi:hypothetical protein